MPYSVENFVRKGEIACYKQFLLFSQCFLQLCIFSASKCGIVWKWVNMLTLSAREREREREREDDFNVLHVERTDFIHNLLCVAWHR